MIAHESAANDILLDDAQVLVFEPETRFVQQDLLLSAGKIKRLAKEIKPRPGMKVINASKKYIIPGLIDSHVHLYHATGLKPLYSENYTQLYQQYLAQSPLSYLYFGYTTLIELNDDGKTITRFKQSSLHPRLHSCGSALVLKNGFTALEFSSEGLLNRFGQYLDQDAFLSGKTTQYSPEKTVEQLAKSGARCIKMYYEQALWYPGGAPDFQLPTLSLLRAVKAAAQKHHLPLLLHATTPEGYDMALKANVDVAVHGMWEWPGQSYLAQEPTDNITRINRSLAKSPVRLQPTFRTIRNTQSMFEPEFLYHPELKHVLPTSYLHYLQDPQMQSRQINQFLARFAQYVALSNEYEDVQRHIESFVTRYRTLINQFDQHGGKLLFGTDTAVGGFGWGAPPGLSGYLEMQDWQQSGIALKTIIRAATIDNAKMFGLADQVGSIAEGKLADMLILTENPLQTIHAYNSISHVILNGEVRERHAFSAMQND